jgi:hypothetical protein
MDHQYDIVERSLFEGIDPQMGVATPWLEENGAGPLEGGQEILNEIVPLDLGPDIPEGANLPASGWPAAVAVRPGNWNVQARDYKLAWGDTLSGLAATYLGTPQRWSEIWAEQSDQFRLNNNPDKLHAGTWLRMPVGAVDTLYCAYGRNPPSGKACAGAPPGGYKTTGTDPFSGQDSNAMMYAGAAAALVAAYVIFKKPKA